jgi:hypothetical protein
MVDANDRESLSFVVQACRNTLSLPELKLSSREQLKQFIHHILDEDWNGERWLRTMGQHLLGTSYAPTMTAEELAEAVNELRIGNMTALVPSAAHNATGSKSCLPGSLEVEKEPMSKIYPSILLSSACLNN